MSEKEIPIVIETNKNLRPIILDDEEAIKFLTLKVGNNYITATPSEIYRAIKQMRNEIGKCRVWINNECESCEMGTEPKEGQCAECKMNLHTDGDEYDIVPSDKCPELSECELVLRRVEE